MPKQSTSTKNPPSEIIYAAPDDLKHVIPLNDYCLDVEFMDGTTGVVLMKHLIFNQKAGVFARLKDLTIFNQVQIKYGTVTWPGNIDLAPDTMYESIKKEGIWTVS